VRPVRRRVDVGRRGEHEPGVRDGRERVEHELGADDVHEQRLARVRDAVRDEVQRRQVEHDGWPDLGDDLAEQHRVRHVAAHDLQTRVAEVLAEALHRAARQVVDHDHVAVVREQPRHQVVPHEPRSPDHQHRSARHAHLATSS
jgi:hypothetical protein